MRCRAVFATFAALGIGLTSGGTSARAAETGKIVKSGNVSLFVETRGAGGARPLIMVNGGPGFDHLYVHCSSAWDTLAKHRRVIFYDQRGTGRSTAYKAGMSCTLADQIADLEAVRASLGSPKIDLLGHSWGGYLVMAYAARHPEAIAHLMIIDSAAPKWGDTEFIFKYIFPDALERQEAFQFAEALGDTEAARQDVHEYLQLLFYDPAHRDEFMSHADGYHYYPAVNQALNGDLARYDLGPELKKYRFPTLVATGRYDINVAPSTAWKIHNLIPGSKFVVFEKSGHLPYFEEPEKFVAAIEDFLAH
ncbi:MAG TPA: alpha/beta fold hydrolase [Candidatus Sulfotelmatobacter sp.]|nr:alpha/beta fold hydrolase [Candidatus Sulfotelmatobacter sp.]